MKKILLSALFFILSIGFLSAQQEASNWYFGENAGIHFNQDGTITALDNGQLFTREGCASISDNNGNLLFYTDGTDVYTQNHSIMPNGTGLFGDQSSTQSAIIVPNPTDTNIYYIFTVGSNQSQTGLKYSIVDMAQNGGLGRVMQKNINLLNACSEKISAVLKDCDSQEIWVITLANQSGIQGNWNTFFSYLITSSGVSNVPVTSTHPVVISDSRGYLKLSPDGTKVACANAQSGLYLFDFDTQTGIISNPLQLNITNSNNKPYGLEFSPSNNLLYVTASNDYFAQDGSENNPASHHSVLVQYNLLATDINSSQIIIDNRQLYRGGLQLGPNGKIYRALSATYEQGTPGLGVINNPNEIGIACDYEHNAVSLGGNNSTQGLPPFIQSFFNQKIDIIQSSEVFSTYLPLCDGDTYTLMADEIPGATYIWSKDQIILPETSHTLTIDQSGHYEVLIELNTDDCDTLEGEAFVEYFENPIAFDSTLFQCDEDGVVDEVTIFNLFEAIPEITDNNSNVQVKFFETQQDLLDEANEIDASAYTNLSNPQVIYALVIDNISDCSTSSQLTLEVSVTQISDYNVPIVCDELNSEDGINTFDLNTIKNDMLIGLPSNITLRFYATYSDALLEANEIVSPYQNTEPYNQILFARAETENSCYGISEVTLTINPIPQVIEDGHVYYCLNNYPETISLESGNLDTNLNNYSYFWSTGDTSESINVNQSGVYTVTITDSAGCSKSRSITVEASNTATIDEVIVIDGSLSYNNTVTVNVSGEGIYHFALFNELGAYRYYQESNIFNNVVPGFYTLKVRDIKNDCGIVEKIISVVGFPSFFTPNNDGYGDTWQVYGIAEQFQPKSRILIFDRFGKLLKELDPLGKGWDGTFNGQPLPNSDYWFAVTLQDGRVFKSHFTLKR